MKQLEMQALSEGVLSGTTHGNAFFYLVLVVKRSKQSPDHYAIDNPLFEAIDQMYAKQNPYLAYHRWYRR